MCWLGFLVNAPGCEQKLLWVRGLSRDTARTLVISNTCLREGRKGRVNVKEIIDKGYLYTSNIIALLSFAIAVGKHTNISILIAMSCCRKGYALKHNP